ncbi:MAG: primosomal protein N', partial [Planctomycetes bacterium]|nr:primosomal protein N' [Planctomycetota bacterium]
EEHENTFKQEEPAPRYHARDVAVLRAQRAGALVVLGSATPSLESFHNARRGKYGYVALAHRVLGLRMPPVEVVDMTEEMHETKRWCFLSRRLVKLMNEALDAGGQVMLFLNRRGFSTLVFCPRCQHALRCPKCQVPMVYHRRRGVALCHYCGEHQPPTGICPACKAGQMRHFGVGTERVEDEIARKFPAFGLARMDTDTTRGRDAHQQLLDRFRSGDARILIGTQMIAKGLDFPQVTLVGVVSADTALYLPDFRASERTYQLVEQVAGRAGRGLRGGCVVVQTTNPHHLSIVAASQHDYRLFADTELDHRRELGYPPFGHLLRIVVAAPRRPDAERRIADLAARLEALPEAAALEVLGPADCPLANLHGKTRCQLLVKARDRRAIHAVARALRPHAGLAGKALVTLDVDPVSML